MKCLLGIDPEKTQKCKPSECASCGWEAAEAARHKECPHCGAHLDSGEKCDCRAAEADGNAEKELKERTKDNDN